MKSKITDVLVLISIAAVLLMLNYFDRLESYAHLMFIPIAFYYFLGKYLSPSK